MRTVTIDTGTLRGAAAGNRDIAVFRGIPFAKAPVGELRWQPPQPLEAWEGVREALEFGPMSPQLVPPEGTFYHREFFTAQHLEPVSEDCLYLNVWTPATRPNEGLPVLVFIHGGGFLTNYSYAPQFDGEALAKRGIVVVTIAYRLGIFGFLAHPELNGESARSVSGNYGLMDQICALQWVHCNIAAFGGDPGKVTISGGSAGGMSVHILMCSPLSRGLVLRGIMQSGGGIDMRRTDPLEVAEHNGKEFLDGLGATTIEMARQLPAQYLIENSPDLDRGGKMFLGPCVDGYLLPDTPQNMSKQGLHHVDDIVIGWSANEAWSMASRIKPSVEAVKCNIRATYGDCAEQLIGCHKLENNEDAFIYLLNHDFTENFIVGSIGWCRLQNRLKRKPSYLYTFTHPLPGSDTGAFHACEHWYVFGTLQRCWRPFTGADYNLSHAVQAYWSNFIKTGDPNSADLPAWTPYTDDAKAAMQLCETPSMSSLAVEQALELKLAKSLETK